MFLSRDHRVAQQTPCTLSSVKWMMAAKLKGFWFVHQCNACNLRWGWTYTIHFPLKSFLIHEVQKSQQAMAAEENSCSIYVFSPAPLPYILFSARVVMLRAQMKDVNKADAKWATLREGTSRRWQPEGHSWYTGNMGRNDPSDHCLISFYPDPAQGS